MINVFSLIIIKIQYVFRYLVQTLDSDSLIFSYVGVALNKKYSIFWIMQVKKILKNCLEELNEFDPNQPQDYKCILLRLYTLVSFTSTGTWSIMNVAEIEKLKAGLYRLCENFIGFLMHNGLYIILQVINII